MSREDIIVSIVIPVYNVEKYLNDCLLSVRKQTYKSIEIIIVDDKSPDRSIDIAQKHAAEDTRVKIYSHERNKKLGAARNTGMLMANGKYIMFLDSDDIYPLDAVANMLMAIEQRQADMIIGKMGWLRHGKITPIKYIDRFVDLAEVYSSDNLRGMSAYKWYLGQACNRIYSLGYLRKNKIIFDEGVYWEDMRFSVSVWLHARNIGFIPQIVYLRTERTDTNNLSITQEYSMKKYLDRDYLEYSIFNSFVEVCENNPSIRDDIIIILQRIFSVTEDILKYRNDNIASWVQEWYRGYKKRHSNLLKRLENI